MAATLTPTQELIQIRLGQDLAEYVATKRAEGLGWRRIAYAISDRTHMVVSHETLRAWYGEDAA
jgi:hypothetical protein